MTQARLNPGTLLVPAAGGTYVATTTTGVSTSVAGRDADFLIVNIVLATTGTVQVQVSNRDVAGEYTNFGSAFTASGNLTIDPMWNFVRVNVSVNGSGATVTYALGERR